LVTVWRCFATSTVKVGFTSTPTAITIGTRAIRRFSFGLGTDVPFSGDFNGDGLDEVGIYRNGAWYIDLNKNFTYDGSNNGDYIISFGQAGDTPVVSPTKMELQLVVRDV
jgi:hypothetical protein